MSIFVIILVMVIGLISITEKNLLLVDSAIKCDDKVYLGHPMIYKETFSIMNNISKSKTQNSLMETLLRLSTTKLSPNIAKVMLAHFTDVINEIEYL